MSDLEVLAAQVRALANEAHQAAGFAARQQRDVSNLAQRVASAAAGSGDGSLRSVLALVETAARALGQCSAQLETTAQHGKNYAAMLAESGSPGTPTAELGTGTAGSAEASALLRSIYEKQSFGFDKGPGRFFLASGDDFCRVAPTMPQPKDGSYLAMIHGAPDLVGVGNTTLDPGELAGLIRMDPNYRAGQPITLFSCSTGKNPQGFAQQLANELGVPVTAPTSLAWLPPEPDGGITITPKDEATGGPLLDRDGKGLGRWRRFVPNRL